MAIEKYLLTEIFYDVYYNILNPIEKRGLKENEVDISYNFNKVVEKKITRKIEDSILEGKLEKFMTNIMGYAVYRQYCDFVEKRRDTFEYFTGIRKYFENVIVNYNPQMGFSIYDYLNMYGNIFNEYIGRHPYVESLISAFRRAYSDDPNDVIISQRGDTLIISRQDDKYKDDLPAACLLNIDTLESVLSEYVDAVKENDNYYNYIFGADFGYTEKGAVEELFLWTIRNATTSDLADVERLFYKYISFITDKTFEDFAQRPVKVGEIFDDELYIMLRKSTVAYETPYYLRFMLRNQIVEFPNMRYGICENGRRPVACIQAIQTSQEIPTNDAYFKISDKIKRDLPKLRYFREFNPMHMASLALFLGLINGLDIKEVHGADYLSLRYQRLAIEKQKSEEEMNRYQHRLTNKYVNTFMRLLEYTEDIHILKYPDDGDKFILKLDDEIHFASPILQELYDLGYQASKKNIEQKQLIKK